MESDIFERIRVRENEKYRFERIKIGKKKNKSSLRKTLSF